MSALGQKQTYAVHKAMSALPPKADIGAAQNNVRFGPKGDISECDRGASYAAISRQALYAL